MCATWCAPCQAIPASDQSSEIMPRLVHAASKFVWLHRPQHDDPAAMQRGEQIERNLDGS
jgi:hypothetical protein